LLKSAIVNEVEKVKPDIKVIERKQALLKNITLKALSTKKKFMAVLQ
jgi:hypothetical protein